MTHPEETELLQRRQLEAELHLGHVPHQGLAVEARQVDCDARSALLTEMW